MGTFLQQLSNKAVWITLIAVFAFGILADHYVLSPQPKYGRDTVIVKAPTPPPNTTVGIVATVPPKITPPAKLAQDTAALRRSAWLQVENATLSAQLDSLLSDRDSLRTKLEVLLAPHEATAPFHFDLLDGKGYLNGTSEMAYLPLKESFGLVLVPSELYLPEITITKRPAWWVKPTLVLGGAATTYFISEHNSTGALVTGGITLIPLLVEF